jgi:hypothetical protein
MVQGKIAPHIPLLSPRLHQRTSSAIIAPMISSFRYLGFAALTLLTIAAASADTPRRVSEEILSTSIGKWQRLELRWVSNSPDAGSALVLGLAE